MNSEDFILRQIQSDDNSSKLSLGNPSHTPLKIFLQKSACDFHQYEIAKTYVLINQNISSNRVWGYITLPHLGCRFLVVDAKRDSIVFYQKVGFTLLNTDSNHSDEHPLMFFDLYKEGLS